MRKVCDAVLLPRKGEAVFGVGGVARSPCIEVLKGHPQSIYTCTQHREGSVLERGNLRYVRCPPITKENEMLHPIPCNASIS